jgi:DNA-binding MarR family transcriptional regulator
LCGRHLCAFILQASEDCIVSRYISIFLLLLLFHLAGYTKAMPPPKKRITKSQYEMLAALRYSLRQFMRFSEEAAHQEGLAPQQHQALLAIKGFPGRDEVTIGELAERLQIVHHSAVGLANRLVREKYIKRKRDKEDRRQVYLSLTPRGETVLEKLSAVHQEQLRWMGPEINLLLERLRKEAAQDEA